MRPMLSGFLSTLKDKIVFHLPGELKKVTNFDRKEDGAVEIIFEGEHMLNIVDKMIADEEWLKEQMRLVGEDFMQKGPEMGYKMNKEIFGEEGPVQVIVSGNLEPLFDYEKEVSGAKEKEESLFILNKVH